MAQPSKERRSVPRIPYLAHAYVHCHNRKQVCQIINISCQGALLSPPILAKIGTSIQLNLKLPQLDELIDLDAVVIRDASTNDSHAYGVSFVNVSRRSELLMKTFVDWVIEQNARSPVTGKHAALPEGEEADDLSRWVDNLDLERLFRQAMETVGAIHREAKAKS